MIVIDPGVPDISNPSPASRNDGILSAEERKKIYRQKLLEHQQGRKIRLKAFLLGKRSYFRSMDLIPRRKRAEDVDLMCRYYNCDQYGSYDDMGTYRDDRQDGDFAYAIPVLSGHVDQSFLQLLKVKPQYTVTNDEKDDATMKMVAAACEEMGVKELNRVLEPKIQSELYNMILGGENYCIVGWEPNKVSPRTAKRLKYKKETFDLPARRECENCYMDVPEDSASCPECKDANIKDIPAGQGQRQTPDGYEEVTLGENTLHMPHMLACQRDMSALEPEDSTFLIEYSYLDKHVMEWEYQSEIEPSSEGLPIEMQLRYDLERASNQIDAHIGTSRLALPGRDGVATAGHVHTGMAGQKQPQERHFWEPSQYGQFVCAVDETLPDGTVLRAGTILGDAYPKGLYIVFGGDSVLVMRGVARRRKVSLVRFGRIAGTNSGAGLKKIMPLQDAENDNFNLAQTVKHTVGHPLTVIDGHYINELPGAGNLLKVTRAGLDDIKKVVAQFPGQALNTQDGAQMIIEGAMQFVAGTSTVGGTGGVGAPDMHAAGTATGIAAMQEQAAGRMSGPVDQRIQRDKELIIQLLENIQEYSSDEQKAELGKRYGKDVAAKFFECNLRQSITVGIKSNSDMPRSMALTQANYLAYGQAVAQILPVAQGNPWVMDFLADLADSMGFPFTTGEGRDDRREAEYRLNVLAEIEAQMLAEEPQIAADPIAFAAAMHAQLATLCAPLIDMGQAEGEEPPDPMEPDEGQTQRVFMQVHPSFMDAYKDAIFGERAKSWSQAHRLVVLQLWLDHYQASMQKQAIEAKMQAMAAQAANPQPPPGPPAKRISESMSYKDAPPDIRRQMEKEEGYIPSQADETPETDTSPTPADQAKLLELGHQQNLELEGAKHDAGEQAKDAELSRQMELETHKAGHNIAIAKAKEKAKPKPATGK